MAEQTPCVSAKGISKSFSGVFVLRDVDFDIREGEVHALVGENGAGKSTLVKIISGVYTPTEGQLYLEGEPANFKSPHAARESGIALIHQEPLTFQDLNVAENLFLGHTRGKGKPVINWKEIYKKSNEVLEELNVRMRAKDPVRDMTVADQQMVEIACALSQNAKVIIFDEPTAALSYGEVQTLFETIRRLKAQGKAMVFIGHRLEEILEISDTVTVLRDGRKVGEALTKDVTQDQLVQMMVGRSYQELVVKEKVPIGDVRLEIKDLTLPGVFHDVSLNVRKGEIVGMAGLVGAGRSEVASAVFGVAPAKKGQIFIDGKEVSIKNPRQAMQLGVAMVSEDRARTGLVLPFAIDFNMSFAVLAKICSKLGFVNTKKESEMVNTYVDELNVKMRDKEQAVQELSGGNQQKVVIAKWLMTEGDILILDEPTRGIDVGAKAEVYRLINELARRGKAILMISSELPEILQLADRVYVMCEGRVTGELNREEMDSERIMTAASTVKKEKEASVA
ncbi:MAG: sugar ABC transporter ATP-binding protein [Lachnospiraceae bacterium]|jgi:ABC-type sugar transport system ATPase subunit|nr:sugar ABC transporter ATP-binding protein [Lachnospiraceae bacterium]